MKTLLTKILLRFKVGTIISILLSMRKQQAFLSLSDSLIKSIFQIFNLLKYIDLKPKVYTTEWAIYAWFNIDNKININFLSNVYFTLCHLDALEGQIYRIYLSSVTFDNRMYNIGKSFLVTPKSTVVDFVDHILSALKNLDDNAYPIASFEVFIVNIKKVKHEEQ